MACSSPSYGRRPGPCPAKLLFYGYNGARPRNFTPTAVIHLYVTTHRANARPADEERELPAHGPEHAASQGAAQDGHPHPVARADKHHQPSSGSLSYFTHPNRNDLNIFLMRHASAGTRRLNPKVDVKRPLDKDGKRDCLQLAQVLNNLRINFDLIISSPLKRCLQTAQFVGTEMGYENKILHAQALEPGAEFTQFQRLVHECKSYENVLMVGHNPNLTQFLGQFIAVNGNREHSNAMTNVRLRKGSIARVTVERGGATLKWLLDPRLVRSLYATSTKNSRRKTSRK